MTLHSRELLVLSLSCLAYLLSIKWQASYDWDLLSLSDPTHHDSPCQSIEPVVYSNDKRVSVIFSLSNKLVETSWNQSTRAVKITRERPLPSCALMMAVQQLESKSALVILTKQYQLTCFSLPTFEKLWSRTVPNLPNSVDSMTLVSKKITTDPTPISPQDDGEVYIALEFKENKRTNQHYKLIYAFDLQEGEMRWYHHIDHNKEDMPHLHQFRKHAKTPQKSPLNQLIDTYQPTNLNWRHFKDCLVKCALPHHWYSSLDTQLKTANFELSVSTKKNVILYSHSNGITVIHLYTGIALLELPLAPFKTYADINCDNSIDVIFTKDSTLHVSTLGSTTLESIYPLFNVSLTQFTSRPPSSYSPPLILQNQKPPPSIVLSNNLGDVLSIHGHSGTIEWMSRTHLNEQPTLLTYSTQHPIGPSVLCISSSQLTLIRSGKIIAVKPLHSKPSVHVRPVVADLTNDGKNDLILSTPNGYQIYLIKWKHTPAYPLMVLTFLLSLAIVSLSKLKKTLTLNKPIALGGQD